MTGEVDTIVFQQLFAGNGEIHELMRNFDWSQTLLGSVSDWPQSLRTAVSIVMNSHYPMCIWWGNEYASLYNDAYCSIVGVNKHSQFLGQSAQKFWVQDWDRIAPLADKVFRTGQATWSGNLQLVIDRYGEQKQAHLEFSCSPIRDETGEIGGVLCICNQSTDQIIEEGRRNQLASDSDLPLIDVPLNSSFYNGGLKPKCEQGNRADLPIIKPSASYPLPSAFLAKRDNHPNIANYIKRLQESDSAPQIIENILESITDAFVALDHQWRYTYVNRTAEQVLGCSKKDLIGKNVWEEVFPSEVGRVAYRELHRAVAEQVAVSWEDFSEIIQRWLEVKAYPCEDGIALYFRDITERKRVEAERERLLQELDIERAQLEAVLRQMPAGVLIADAASNHLILANEQVENIVGHSYQSHYKLDEYEQMINFIGLHPDGRPYKIQEWPLMRSLKSGEVVIGEEIKLQLSDASNTFIDVNSAPVLDSQGRIVAAVAVFQDITNRKRTDTALRHSEARFRRMFECNMVGMGVWTKAGEIIEANDALLNMIGYSRQELEAGLINWQYLTPPEYKNTDEQILTEIETKGLAINFEKEYIHKDGRRIPILLGGASFVDDPESGVFFALDLSQRRQMQASLRQNEAHLRLAMQAARMVAWSWNAKTDMIVRSENACEILGLAPENINGTGKQGWQFTHPDDLAKHQATVQAAIDTKGNYVSEFRAIRPDNGAIIWIEDRGKVTCDATGQIISIEGALFDISDRKQAEQEREQLLEREKIAREQAEATNRIKDEFLAVLSHELRSPLNPILGWTKLLRTRKFDQQAIDRALETIERNAKLQAQLIEDLLDVSRILQGKMVLNVCSVNLVSVIEAALETVQLAVDVKGIDIHKVFKSNLGKVSGDPARLQQVVWNLLSNAIKFTPPKGQVEVRLEQDGIYAQIQVKDTGKGIKSDFLPYVFEYFRQEDGTTTRNFGGLGLGLAIVRHLVELHGGTVQVDSPGEGLGATFTVKLPLVAIASETTRDNEKLVDTSNLDQVKILVVDDEPDMRELAIVILEEYGADVRVVASAAEAFNVLDQFQADILISDIGMPDVDGYTLIRQLRKKVKQQGGQIPAIALTAYAGELNQQQALKAGFQRHIAKPVDPDDLVQAIISLVK